MGKRRYRADIDIQAIYDNAPVVDGKKQLNTESFYNACTNLIKWRLMPDLIYRGYYKDGVKQVNYDEEDILDCFTYILGKIHERYDRTRGTLPTFIRTWIRGYATRIIQKQRRQRKYATAIISLDAQIANLGLPEYPLSYDITSITDLDDYLDEKYFGVSSDLTFTKEDIKAHREFLQSLYAKDQSESREVE